LPFLVLGFFCGIRPRGELEKLEWRDVDLADRVVTIRPEVSKTHRRRFPELSENAIVWLEEYRQRGGHMEGRIVPVG
jgi:integrase